MVGNKFMEVTLTSLISMSSYNLSNFNCYMYTLIGTSIANLYMYNLYIPYQI